MKADARGHESIIETYVYEEGGTSKGCDATCRTMAIEIRCVRDRHNSAIAYSVSH